MFYICLYIEILPSINILFINTIKPTQINRQALKISYFLCFLFFTLNWLSFSDFFTPLLIPSFIIVRFIATIIFYVIWKTHANIIIRIIYYLIRKPTCINRSVRISTCNSRRFSNFISFNCNYLTVIITFGSAYCVPVVVAQL